MMNLRKKSRLSSYYHNLQTAIIVLITLCHQLQQNNNGVAHAYYLFIKSAQPKCIYVQAPAESGLVIHYEFPDFFVVADDESPRRRLTAVDAASGEENHIDLDQPNNNGETSPAAAAKEEVGAESVSADGQTRANEEKANNNDAPPPDATKDEKITEDAAVKNDGTNPEESNNKNNNANVESDAKAADVGEATNNKDPPLENNPSQTKKAPEPSATNDYSEGRDTMYQRKQQEQKNHNNKKNDIPDLTHELQKHKDKRHESRHHDPRDAMHQKQKDKKHHHESLASEHHQRRIDEIKRAARQLTEDHPTDEVVDTGAHISIHDGLDKAQEPRNHRHRSEFAGAFDDDDDNTPKPRAKHHRRKEHDINHVVGTVLHDVERDGYVQICTVVRNASPSKPMRIKLTVSDLEIVLPPTDEGQVGVERELLSMENEVFYLERIVQQILKNADLAKNMEVKFHNKSVEMNKASWYWPMMQTVVLIGTGFVQAGNIVRFLKSRYLI